MKSPAPVDSLPGTRRDGIADELDGTGGTSRRLGGLAAQIIKAVKGYNRTVGAFCAFGQRDGMISVGETGRQRISPFFDTLGQLELFISAAVDAVGHVIA